MKKILAAFIFGGIVSLGICQTGSDIYATNSQDDYTEQYFYGLELPYAPYKSQVTWVEAQYIDPQSGQSRTAVAQVLDDGPQNVWDAYWNSGTSRVMFQNLQQWLPQAEEIGRGDTGAPWNLGRVPADPTFIGTSQWYTNSNPLYFLNPNQYPSWTKDERYWTDYDPTILNNIEKIKLWKNYTTGTNAGIDLSGGVWQHLGESVTDDNIRRNVSWAFCSAPPGPAFTPQPNVTFDNKNQPIVTGTVVDTQTGLDIGLQSSNGVVSPAGINTAFFTANGTSSWPSITSFACLLVPPVKIFSKPHQV